MKLGIYYNANQVEATTAQNLAGEIARRGGDAVIFSYLEEIGNVDRLIVLGGDGTVLRAAKRAAVLHIPIVGVNFGRLGFLTEFGRTETDKAAELALTADCSVVHRSMLKAELNGNEHYCLNEISMLRPVTELHDNRVARISVMIDGSRAGDFAADGLVVATPTGSTAYSLSAGGSIMTPDCKTFLLTPVCAFSLRSRPIVYPDSSTLSFGFTEDKLMLYGDGVYLGQVDRDSMLRVSKAERSVAFLTADPNGYFRRLTEKINN